MYYFLMHSVETNSSPPLWVSVVDPSTAVVESNNKRVIDLKIILWLMRAMIEVLCCKQIIDWWIKNSSRFKMRSERNWKSAVHHSMNMNESPPKLSSKTPWHEKSINAWVPIITTMVKIFFLSKTSVSFLWIFFNFTMCV